MKEFELLNKTYEEKVEIPDADMGGEPQFAEFTVKNTYDVRVALEAKSEDKDVEVVFCPEHIEANGSAIIKIKYAPGLDRRESVIGKKITIRTYF